MNSHRSLPHHVVPFLALAVLAGCEEEIEPPVYQLVPVTARDIVVSVSAAGTVEPIQTVEVKSKASGEIIDVLAETGDVVQRGSMLVRVDPRVPSNGLMQAEADIDVAEASLANAESQLRRAEALYETQSIAEQEFEAARLARANANAQLVRAQRSLEDAKIAFEDTEVRAPATGVILERNVEVGTVISSATREVGGGSVLMKMANLDTVQVRTLVDETDIGKVQPQLEVTITVDAYPNQPFRGRVLKIEPQALEQQNVTMFPVLIRIANDRGILRPGMNAEVEIHVGERQRVLAIPNAALRTQRDIASAASVLGLDMEVVQQQLAAARSSTSDERR
ncbi:MAG: efflux RND transporter periplasmic adaptor subunit, partial [Gemmatimonadales bacterium]